MLPGQPNHLEIPRGLKDALCRIRENKYRRGKRRWETASAPDIDQHTVTSLKLKNLVSIEHGTGRDRVYVTELGQSVVDMVTASRRRPKQ